MRKFIITHEAAGTEFTNGFIISRNYSHSLFSFQELAKEAKEYFPFLEDSDIECLTVLKSDWCKGYSIIRFSLPVGTKHSDFSDYMPDVIW